MGKNRGRVFTPRWGITTLALESPERSKTDQVAYLNRAVKRANKASGYVTAKKPATWSYTVNGQDGTVVAHTRSEARAEIKKELGLKGRLPVGVKIERVTSE